MSNTFKITDEMVDFNTESQGAFGAILKTLGVDGALRLSKTVNLASMMLMRRYGVAPTEDAVLSLPSVKRAVLARTELDEEALCRAAEIYIPEVAYSLVSGENEEQAGATKTPEELAEMPGQQRLNYARAHGLK